LSENDSIPTLSFSEDDQRVMANYEWREEMKIPDEINPENDVPHTVEFLTEWDIKTGSKLTEKKVREGKGWTSSFSIGHNWQTAKNLDQSRKVTLEPNFQLAVRDAKTDAVLVILPQYHARTTSRKAEFSPDGTQIVGANYFFENAVYLWTRNYPERWWGIAWMPTFWVAMVLFAAAVFSFWRDLKSL
jgi:hypothetical protein